MGIRELILLATVAFICLAALVRPKIGLYGYVWYALMRPDLLAFVESKYPLSMVLAVALALGSLPKLGRISALFQASASRLTLFLQIPIAISVLFAVNPALSYDRYDFYIRMIVVLLLIPLLLETEKDVIHFLLVMAFSLGVVGLKFGVHGLLQGGVVLVGGYGDMLGDNNFVALVLAMLIPLCWYQLRLTSSAMIKGGLLSIIGTCIAAIVMSNSRGSVLAMGVGFVMLLLHSRRKVGLLLVAGLCVGGAIYLVRDSFIDRMSTLRNPEEESSAASRIVHLKAAWAMWQDYPLFGVGFGGYNYAKLSPQYGGPDEHHVAHNTYIQMLVDSGLTAFALYVWLLVGTIVRLMRSAARWERAGSMRSGVPRAMATALIVFVAGATFYSCHRMDFPYMLLLCAGAWENIEGRFVWTDNSSVSTDDMTTPVGRALVNGTTA